MLFDKSLIESSQRAPSPADEETEAQRCVTVPKLAVQGFSAPAAGPRPRLRRPFIFSRACLASCCLTIDAADSSNKAVQPSSPRSPPCSVKVSAGHLLSGGDPVLARKHLRRLGEVPTAADSFTDPELGI